VIYFKFSKINFPFLYALWMEILILFLVKKTKMKIQNKYIFRTIISEFLYFHKKKKRIDQARLSDPSRMGLAWLPGLGAWVKNKIKK